MKEDVKYITDFPATDNRYGEDEWYRQHANSIVIINCKSSDIYYPEHWTPLSIKCAFNGKEFYKFRNTIYAVNDANFLLLNEGNRYESYINSESITESFTLNFTRDNIKALTAFAAHSGDEIIDDPFKEKFSGLNVFEKLYQHNNKTYSYINAIKNYYNNGYNDSRQILEILYLFLDELIHLNKVTSIEIDQVQAKKRTTRIEIYQRLHIAKDYIHSCYYEDISLEELSKICFLNPFHLLREFKKYFKITPHKYLTQIRMEEAKRLIEKTSISLIDIAGEVGFEDVSSFSKLFKSHFGISPHVYRKGAGSLVENKKGAGT
ncbi:MAG: AraC family transcriptional regulator [Ignavibacteriaceae bacterium]